MDFSEFSLLYGGAYSIKNYYIESGNPRQMRGASEILNECSYELNEHLKCSDVPDEHIIKSGATLSALVPKDIGERLAFEAEKIYLENSRTANVAFVAVPYKNNYNETKRRAINEYENRRAIKFISWEYQNSLDSLLSYKRADPNVRQPCPRCRLRNITYHVTHDNGEEMDLCTSCAKREKKSGQRKYGFRKECGCQFDYSYEINTTEKLRDRNGHIALLYADVNNLGGQDDKKTFKDDRTFHNNVEKAVKNAVYSAIRSAMSNEKLNSEGKIDAKFEIIALGGDDVCLLLPGNTVLLAAKTLMEEFKKNEHGLTISVAACVANDTTAITYMESITTRALKNAKEHAYKNKSNKQSAIYLSYYENPSSIFPMTEEDFIVFCDLMKQMLSVDVGVTALRNISEARRTMVLDDEFKLFFRYYITRSVDIIKNNKSILERIYTKYNIRDPWSDFITWHNQKI